MNKKEVSEIKSLFKRDGGAIDRICGCLIDGEQQIRMTFSDMFLSLSQEEIDKYFEIFRKALSGSLGKNLHSLDYTLDQELSGEGHKRLMQLKATGLKDETVLEEFYKSVAETYHFGESYYVVMIHCNYDVPGRGSDNLDMDDASEEVYEFILCCICPVKLSEAGLCYNTQTNRVEERMRDQWIEAPVNAFLFPATPNKTRTYRLGSDKQVLLRHNRRKPAQAGIRFILYQKPQSYFRYLYLASDHKYYCPIWRKIN